MLRALLSDWFSDGINVVLDEADLISDLDHRFLPATDWSEPHGAAT